MKKKKKPTPSRTPTKNMSRLTRESEEELNARRMKLRNQLMWMCLPVGVIAYVLHPAAGAVLFATFLYLLLKKPKPLEGTDESFVRAVGQKILQKTLKGATAGLCKKPEDLAPLRNSGLFPENFKLTGHRWVKGKYAGTPFSYFDLQVHDDSEYKTEMFRGGWYILDVHAPESVELRLDGKSKSPIAPTGGALVPIPCDKLEGRFKVLASDEETGGLLTDELCERALLLRKACPGAILCYRNGQMHIGMSDGLTETFSYRIMEMAKSEDDMVGMIQEDINRIISVLYTVLASSGADAAEK